MDVARHIPDREPSCADEERGRLEPVVVAEKVGRERGAHDDEAKGRVRLDKPLGEQAQQVGVDGALVNLVMRPRQEAKRIIEEKRLLVAFTSAATAAKTSNSLQTAVAAAAQQLEHERQRPYTRRQKGLLHFRRVERAPLPSSLQLFHRSLAAEV